MLFSFVVFHFFFSFVFPRSFFFLLRFLLFFLFPSSKQTPKPEKNRTVPTVNMTISFCENSIFGPRWTGRFGVARLR